MASVERLARLAYRCRPDGTRGWRARRAWRALTGAAERGDGQAIEAVWQGWLRDPADDVWELVSRWRTPEDVFTAVPGRPAGSRAAIGRFCLRHDLLPDNDNDRALLFVLTGHHERYEALDPDGTLLAAAYRAAAEATREVLRHTMTALGELDVVRVIVDRPGHVLTGAEADYVARQLAGAGEWARLRRLIPTMPLPDALRAARLCPAGNDPFLTQLARADPDIVTAAAAADECQGLLALGNSTFLYVHTALHAVSMDIESTSTSVHRCVAGRARETLLTDYGAAPRLGGLPGGFVVQSSGTLHFVPAALFCGPDRLLTNVAGNLESWQRDGTNLARTATTFLAKVHGLTPVPAHDRVVITTDDLIWLDAGTLTPVSPPAGIPRQASWFSPDGSLAVVHDDDSADVHDVRLRHLVELASRPLTAATPTDLKTVGALANLPPPAEELVTLLRMGLEHRFGADVALGTWAAAGAGDIALGG